MLFCLFVCSFAFALYLCSGFAPGSALMDYSRRAQGTSVWCRGSNQISRLQGKQTPDPLHCGSGSALPTSSPVDGGTHDSLKPLSVQFKSHWQHSPRRIWKRMDCEPEEAASRRGVVGVFCAVTHSHRGIWGFFQTCREALSWGLALAHDPKCRRLPAHLPEYHRLQPQSPCHWPVLSTSIFLSVHHRRGTCPSGLDCLMWHLQVYPHHSRLPQSQFFLQPHNIPLCNIHHCVIVCLSVAGKLGCSYILAVVL